MPKTAAVIVNATRKIRIKDAGTIRLPYEKMRELISRAVIKSENVNHR